MARILVVDDNRDIAFMIGEKLRHLVGGEISTANGGEAALAVIRSDPPDLVVLDICMPEIDGYEVCRLLKTDSRTAQVPVIFMTANCNDLRSRIKGLDLGADDYIVQPVDDLELVTRINIVLRIKKLRDQLEQATGEISGIRQERDELQSRLGDLCRLILRQGKAGEETRPGSEAVEQAGKVLAWLGERGSPREATDHGDAREVKPANAESVSGYRTPQIRQSGLSAIHQVCGKAADKRDVVPGDRLPSENGSGE